VFLDEINAKISIDNFVSASILRVKCSELRHPYTVGSSIRSQIPKP